MKLDDDHLERLKKRAAESGTSVSGLIERAVRLLLQASAQQRRYRFHARYLDVDCLARVSEAVRSPVGAPAARATILRRQPELGPNESAKNAGDYQRLRKFRRYLLF